MAQHILDYFGVDVLRARKGSAGVPKIVEADGVSETRLLEERGLNERHPHRSTTFYGPVSSQDSAGLMPR